ncbi:aromatic amino acid lyase, partial [Acinetobacter baumannii]
MARAGDAGGRWRQSPVGRCPRNAPRNRTSTRRRMTDRPTVADIVAIARHRARLEISVQAATRVLAARAVVERYAASEVPVYGLTTALGAG